MSCEAVGKVGEEVGEDLSFASLGTKDLGQHDPLRIAIHEMDVRALRGKEFAQDTPSLARSRFGNADDDLAKGVGMRSARDYSALG